MAMVMLVGNVPKPSVRKVPAKQRPRQVQDVVHQAVLVEHQRGFKHCPANLRQNAAELGERPVQSAAVLKGTKVSPRSQEVGHANRHAAKIQNTLEQLIEARVSCNGLSDA